MSLKWKIFLVVILILTVVVVIVKSKNSSLKPRAETGKTEEKTIMPERSYDLSSGPITDSEISGMARVAGAESVTETEEDKDLNLVNTDNQALNNFNNVYVSSDF